MKHILILLLASIILAPAFAQKPVQVPSYATVHKTIPWYKEQQQAWAKQVEKTPNDANAWYNYFKVNRILIFNDHDDKRDAKEKDKQLEDIVNRMGEAIPDSYEYNFFKWQLTANDMKYYSYLEKAVAIDPDRKEHIDYMINIGELEGMREQRNEYSIKKMKAGSLSSGMMYYNYNTVIGLEQNAILLTSGDNDTYPVWALQAMGTRPDVKVLNLYFMHIPEYRNKIFRELGLAEVNFNDKAEEQDFFKNKLVPYLSKNKKEYPVYLSLTTTSCRNTEMENNLYLTGLSYQYDSSSFDNTAVLKKNFEKNYALDYIDKPFYDEISEELVKKINQNYIVPMLKLYEHYKASGDTQKQAWIKEKLIYVARGYEDEASVLKYLD